jgi:hypothetical protein
MGAKYSSIVTTNSVDDKLYIIFIKDGSSLRCPRSPLRDEEQAVEVSEEFADVLDRVVLIDEERRIYYRSLYDSSPGTETVQVPLEDIDNFLSLNADRLDDEYAVKAFLKYYRGL